MTRHAVLWSRSRSKLDKGYVMWIFLFFCCSLEESALVGGFQHVNNRKLSGLSQSGRRIQGGFYCEPSSAIRNNHGYLQSRKRLEEPVCRKASLRSPENGVSSDHRKKKLNRVSFSHYLQSSVQVGGAAVADNELLRMENLWYQDGDKSSSVGGKDSASYRGPVVQPDLYCYTIVMNGYAKDKRERVGGPKAEAVFERLMHRRNVTGDPILRPNVRVYTALIHAWARCGDGPAAECVLEKMKLAYKELKNTVSDSSELQPYAPDTVAYSTVMDAYSRTPRGRRPRTSRQDTSLEYDEEIPASRAEYILKEMLQLYETGENPYVKPNAFTYTALMKCYINSFPGVKGAQMAEDQLQTLLQEVYQQDKNESTTVTSNLVNVYTTVVDAWAKSGGGMEAAQHAEGLLRDFLLRAISDPQNYNVNVHLYTSVVDAYSRSRGLTAASEAAMNILREMEDRVDLHPNTKTYTSVITAIVRSGDPDIAAKSERLLRRMSHPDSVAYACVIHAWAKCTEKGSAQRAEDLLFELNDKANRQYSGPRIFPPDVATHAACMHAWDRSIHLDEQKIASEHVYKILQGIVSIYKGSYARSQRRDVNTFVFNTAIQCFAKSGRLDAGERAEEVIDMMYDLADKHAENHRKSSLFYPNQQTFAFAIDGWVTSGHSAAAKRTLQILDRMNQANLRPNARVLSAAIEAVSRHGQSSNDADVAENLLRQWIELIDQGDRTARPSVQTFTKIINIFARSRDPRKADRAMDLLNYMEKLSTTRGYEKVAPNTIAYNSVVNCIGKCKEEGSARRALELLQKMAKLHKSGNTDIKPDSFTYGAVVHALANSGDVDAAAQAELLVDQVEQKYYKDKDESCRPNRIIYNGVLYALAQGSESEPERAHRAMDLLRKMEDAFKNGDKGIEPDLMSYTTVAHALANSQIDGAAEKAEGLLSQCEEAAKIQNRSFPDLPFYSAVIHAYIKSREPGTQQKAEDLLDKMEGISELPGRQNCRPNNRVVNTVLYGWALSDDSNKAVKASALLDRLRDMHLAGYKNSRPQLFSHNWVIYAAASSQSSSDEERKALFDIARNAFESISEYNLDPNESTNSFYLQACIALLPDGHDREKTISDIFSKCCENGYVTSTILLQLQNSVPEFLRTLATQLKRESVQSLLDEIPMEWTRKLAKDTPQNNTT